MRLPRMQFKVPLAVQVGAVAALFIAALVVLWITGARVLARERRRAEAKNLLRHAGEALASQGGEIVARTEGRSEGFPYYPENQALRELDHQLQSAAVSALREYEGIEGGYYVSRFQKFLGFARSRNKRPEAAKAKKTAKEPGADRSLPPVEADLIDILVDAAIRKKQVLFSIEELEDRRPVTVAIRAAPILIDGQVAGATWVITRLIDPLFLDQSLQGYQLAAGLALGGILLSLGLTSGLAQTVRRQTIERDRLQVELRRSERLAALGKLLAGVAHEVRNPLAGIRSTVQLWERGIGPDAESFEGLHNEVDRLEGIVARLLHFSRADAQDLAPGDLNAVVVEAARLVRAQADAQGVRVEVEIASDLPCVMMAAPALLQVFRNLTSNALHAMPNGGVLGLSTRYNSMGRRVEAHVVDTGPGLTPDIEAHLFEPFYTTKAGGTGLGLAIAREIALAHQGELCARNRFDRSGALFVLSLPASTVASQGPSHE